MAVSQERLHVRPVITPVLCVANNQQSVCALAPEAARERLPNRKGSWRGGGSTLGLWPLAYSDEASK